MKFCVAMTSAKVLAFSGSEAWYLGPQTMSPSGQSQVSSSPAQKKSKDLPSSSQA